VTWSSLRTIEVAYFSAGGILPCVLGAKDHEERAP
jgi:hypothetical protein